MCGIFIVINKNLEPINIERSIKSLNLMKGRGPDWCFYKLFGKNIFLGQVILSMTGKLKKKISDFYSISNRYFIVFNGEIYNYKNIYKNYFERSFDENITDTRILLNLFDIKKIEKINSLLDGMYAYVVFDKKKKNLIISSDPQGEKRLYIYEDKKTIILSSEINSILHYTNDKEIDPNILKNYFYTRHFINFNNTLFKKIRILDSGLLQTLCLNKFIFENVQSITINDYINENLYDRNNNRKESDVEEELDFLIKKNLTEMIPNVRNFASIVSGGIDSTLISKYLIDIKKPNYLIFLNHVGKDNISSSISNFEEYLGKILIKKIDQKLYKKFLIESIKICTSPIFSHDFVGKLILSKTVKELNCKAVLTNDAKAAAMGEMIFGGAQGMKDFIFITLGTGLGSGIVVNGQLVYGHDSFAGEIGHVIMFSDGRACGCGRNGCLETYCSATGLIKTYQQLIKNDAQTIDSKYIYDQAQIGDKYALEAFNFSGDILGLALANSVAYTSPEAIFLFGGLALAGDYIFKPTIESFEKNLLRIYKNKIKILPSQLPSNNGAVLGAASLVFF